MTISFKSMNESLLKISTVRSGGAKLHVFSGGPADAALPPIVFLHAGVCDSRMWQGQLDAFSSTRRVVAYDRRGFGKTLPVDERYSNVDDLWAVMDDLDVDRAVLVGCSQGGRIALDATLAQASRVAGLVLVAAAIGGAPYAPIDDPRAGALMAAYEKAEQSRDVDEENRIAAHVWLDGPFEPEGRVKGSVRELFLAMNRIVLIAPRVGTTDAPLTAYANLSRITTPTLAMWGPLDVPSVIDNLKHAAATIPGARSCAIEAVAHLPNLERADVFNACLAEFAQSL